MCTHVSKRGSTYYYRRKTPTHLVEKFGKQVMKSLGTKDKTEACSLARKLGAHYDDLFASASAKLAGELNATPELLAPQTPKTTSPKLFDGLEIEDAETYAFLFMKHLRSSRERALNNNNWAQFTQGLDNMYFDAEEYIRTGSHPFDDKPIPMWQAEARLKAITALREYRDLPFTESMFRASKEVVTKVTTLPKQELSEIITKWAKERTPRAQTVTKMNRVIDRFTELTGISDVTQVTKKHCVAFKDGLLSAGSSNVNVNQYLTELSTLLSYASKQALIESNPAVGLKIVVKDSAKTKRLSFDLTSLNLIFSSPIYSNSIRPAGGKGEAAYWLPLLALYTGARLDELCQLNTDDIYKDSYHDDDNQKIEVWTLLVTNEGEDQKLKNDGSRRRIPLHSELIRLGFISYIDSLDKGLAFPELSKTATYASLSANWSKWFGRYLRETVLVKDKRMVFHSFRHSFKDYCREAGIHAEVHNALTGHSGGSAADNYGSELFPLRPLAEAISKIKVNGLRVSHSASSNT